LRWLHTSLACIDRFPVDARERRSIVLRSGCQICSEPVGTFGILGEVDDEYATRDGSQAGARPIRTTLAGAEYRANR
jgi:hypothetical protein